MNVLIVCHAGQGVGLGHLSRSLVVADSLQQKFSAYIKFIVQGESINPNHLKSYDVQVLDNNKDIIYTMKQELQEKYFDIVIFDLFPKQIPNNFSEFLIETKNNNTKTISIDGLFEYQSKLDLIFIPSFYYKPSVELTVNSPVIFGWDCFLLDLKYKPKNWQPGLQVIALTGGSDTTNLGLTLPSFLEAELPKSTKLDWVTGPFAKEPIFPDTSNIKIINHQELFGLDKLMLSSHYALTVYGVSFFELLSYGIPTVVFSPYEDKDNKELLIIEKEGVALVAIDEVDAVKKLKYLMTNNILAKSLSEKAKKKMSVSGSIRFSQAVSDLMN